jgi:hypothetical protein
LTISEGKSAAIYGGQDNLFPLVKYIYAADIFYKLTSHPPQSGGTNSRKKLTISEGNVRRHICGQDNCSRLKNISAQQIYFSSYTQEVFSHYFVLII